MGKRERTRAAILTEAIRLFGERGYEAVTMAEIAREVGVSEMTVFRHFPTKAALVVEDPYDPLIAEAILARPATEAPIAAVVRAVRAAWHAVPAPETDTVRERLRLVASTHVLVDAMSRGSRSTEAAIANALVQRGTDARRARIVGAAVVAALNAALLDWAVNDDGELDNAISAALDALEDCTS